MNTGIEALITRIQNDQQMLQDGCAHLSQINQVTPQSESCETCVQMGKPWIRLRLCLTCGHVGCCDSSTGKHARRHYQETNHPIILSFEPQELWMYCFEDDEIYIAPES
jgi:uncharacterized UBP type Zn finger protein